MDLESRGRIRQDIAELEQQKPKTQKEFEFREAEIKRLLNLLPQGGAIPLKYGRNALTFKKAWERTRLDPKSPDDFPTNLVGVQITERRSRQNIVPLPHGKYYTCSHHHTYRYPDRVYKYMGHYLCPKCGRPLRTWEGSRT